MNNTLTRVIQSPLGDLQLVAEGEHLVAIHFPGMHAEGAVESETERSSGSTAESLATQAVKKTKESAANAVLEQASAQLAEYFAGTRREFDLPLAATGTEFQQEVWQALREIPWGELRSYRDIACALQRPRAVRAVGAANGRNPLPIVVPCHRVIGANGSLTGFAGGLAAKALLLTLEGSLPEA
ncbi:MAG: methylated-DNA--[protein]-cysteine S-methyltransferase [Haliea sp.]|jgi:methylated-DNA-[protein]-cysteine S-methyltransferase|nr:methylated-DNA--[protein]-cysteine S-methyltransferase [Haliea sp.]MDP4917890.1 methylated-DNA--[protein]-cysteine S-methyltransferase [Haliea sp.]MDP5065497.1 methylated-DNA--[protein]-cysteine S-methyltransferase [Haliea sp.]